MMQIYAEPLNLNVMFYSTMAITVQQWYDPMVILDPMNQLVYPLQNQGGTCNVSAAVPLNR